MKDDKGEEQRDALATFQRLMTAAEAFVNRAPKVKRIEAERTALLDAISHSQLMLSVRRLPPAPKPSKPEAQREDLGRLQRDLTTAGRRIAALERELRALKPHLETMREAADKAGSIVDQALTGPSNTREDAAA